MNKKLYLGVFLYLTYLTANAQTVVTTGFENTPNMMWQRSIGGSKEEHLIDFKETVDHNFLISFNTESSDGDIGVPNAGSYDLCLIKVSSEGIIQWRVNFGTWDWEHAHGIVPNADGSCWFFFSSGPYTSRNYKVSSWGEILSTNNFNNASRLSEVQGITSRDGNIILAANDSGIPVVIKYNQQGNIIWRVYPMDNYDDCSSIKYELAEMNDGSIVVVWQVYYGYAYESTPWPPNYHSQSSYWGGEMDIIITKISSSGAVQWLKCFGGTDPDYISDVAIANDGNIMVLGKTRSWDGDVASKHYLEAYPETLTDLWIFKIDSSGNLIWEKCLGGSSSDSGNKFTKTANGDFIIVGYTYSGNGEAGGPPTRGFETLVLRVDNEGMVKWTKKIGPSSVAHWVGQESFINAGVVQNADGIYVCTFAMQNNTEVSGHHGGDPYSPNSIDISLVKLENQDVCDEAILYNGSISKNLLIHSNSSIVGSGKVLREWGRLKFKTQNSILLQSGFEIKEGAVFETELNKGCNN